MARYRRLVNLVALLCVASQCCMLKISGAEPPSSAAAKTSCPAGREPVYSVNYPKDRGGMNSLLQTTKSHREALFNRNLPYEVISMEINKVYNNSSPQISPFVDLWVSQSLNALLLAGFVLIVGLLLPALMIGLWLFWECCYEVDEEDEEENRNLYWKPQVVAWSLSLALLISLLLLTIFLFILLVANSWVSAGVSEGGGVVETVLPELVQLRDHSLERVSNVTRNDLCTLRQDLNSTILSRVSSNVVTIVNSSFFFRVDELYSNISKELELRGRILVELDTLLSRLSELHPSSSNNSTLSRLLKNVTLSLSDVISQCSLLSNSSGSGLDELCHELLSNQECYLPSIGGGVAGLEEEGGLLLQLRGVVSSYAFSQPDSFDSFNKFLAQLAHNLTVHVNISSEYYFGETSSLEQRLASFDADVQRYSSLLSFGWPHSQEQLNVYLGNRYLENWDMFRSVCTVTFVLITIILGVCLLVAMVMGLWHVFTIYKCGEEEVNIEGAHQAGTMMKKLAFGFTGICAVSAIFYAVFICVAGVLDQGCGRHGNFSNLMQYVIDNNQTWGATFPLGAAIFENGSYPLTVGKVLDGCRRNQSLFTVLHLEDCYNLNDIIDVPESEGLYYFDVMRSIAESLGVTDVYPSSNKLRLLANASTVPVNWSEFTSLTRDDLFSERFVGLTHLQEFLKNVTSAASTHSLSSSNLSQIEMDNFISFAESASRNTSVLAEYIDHILLPDVVSTATALRDDQSSLTSTHLLAEITDIERDLVSVVPMKSREQLYVAATKVICSLSNFTSSAKDVLLCETGFCHALSDKYDRFSSAVCNDVVQGMDVYWLTLVFILSLSLFVILLSLILASRFIDLELEKSNRNNRFHLTSAVIRQIRAMFWFLLGNVVNLWLIVVVSEDDFFHQESCRNQPPGCCPTCVWGFGIFFLILFFGVGGIGRVYQCVVLHRVNKFEAMKVRRYWMDRKKATQFYTQLCHFVQDVVFLILAGSYIRSIGTLNIPSFFSISLSIIGAISYLIYLYLERSYISTYFHWLRTEAHKYIKFNRQGAEPPTVGGQANGGQSATANRRRPGGRYGSSESEQSEDDSQGTTQPDADWMYNSNHLSPSAGVEHVPLPVIHERSESMDPTGNDELETASSAPPPPPSSHHNGVPPIVGGARLVRGQPRQVELEHDSENELSQVHPNMSTIPLDNLNHSEFTASQIRLHRQQLHGSNLSSRHTDYAASSASYYSSSNSLTAASEVQQGYCSSSQAPEDHYDSSDYRDDYDSDYSHGYSQRYLNRRYLSKLSGLPGEMSVEV